MFEYRVFLEKGIPASVLNKQPSWWVDAMLAIMSAEGEIMEKERRERG